MSRTCRMSRADCLWAAKQPHPIVVARRFWPKSRAFPAGRYPSIRRAFKRHGVYYPWPVRLPRGHGCVEKAMGRPLPLSPRMQLPCERRAAKERKSLRGRAIPKNDVQYFRPVDIWLQAMRDSNLPTYNGSCSILEARQ